MKWIRTLLPVTAFSLIAGAALASTDDVVIRVADYDLKSVSGVAKLHHDIVVAAESICADYPKGAYRNETACVEDKVDQAVQTSKVALLVQFHQALPAKSRYQADPPEARSMTLISMN